MTTPFKIAVIGSHGTGKTTLVHRLAYHLKKQSFNVGVVEEVARECPFPLNKKVQWQTACHTITNQIKKELDKEAQGFDVIISDRSPMDALVYLQYAKEKHCSSFPLFIDDFTELALSWMHQYDYVIKMDYDEDFSLQGDCLRDKDKVFGLWIAQEFENYLQSYSEYCLIDPIHLTKDSLNINSLLESILEKIAKKP